MANVPTVSWAETTPAGTDAISAGDDRIRELKTQVREIINVDHDFPSSGQASDNGQHKKVTLQEQADLGTGAVGTTILGSQTVSTRGELVYTNEDDVDIQLTKGATAYPSQSTTLADWSTIMNLIYPVGSYYFNDSVATNPGTLLGVGTWVAVEESVLVGYKSGSAEFGTAGGTGGAKTVNAAHTHNVPAATDTGWGTGTTCTANGKLAVGGAAGGDGAAPYASNDRPTGSGGSAAQSTLQPYRTVYMWRRTV